MRAVMDFVPVLFALIVVVGSFLFLSSKAKKKQVSLKKDRAGYGLIEFKEHFLSIGVSEKISEAIYGHLQGLMSDENFPVQPEDDLTEVYGIGTFSGVGLDEVINDLSEKLNCEKHDDVQGVFEAEFNNTVESLARYISFLETVQKSVST